MHSYSRRAHFSQMFRRTGGVPKWPVGLNLVTRVSICSHDQQFFMIFTICKEGCFVEMDETLVLIFTGSHFLQSEEYGNFVIFLSRLVILKSEMNCNTGFQSQRLLVEALRTASYTKFRTRVRGWYHVAGGSRLRCCVLEWGTAICYGCCA